MIKRIAIGGLALIGLLLLWIAFEWITFPDVARLAKERPRSTAFQERRRKELRAAGKDDRLLHQWVSYERISPYLRRAVLVAEDDQFYEHEGVDIEAMKDAIERDWQRKRMTQGGSTITQQLAKNLYLSPSRNPIRKVREYFIARSLERHLSKKRILEIYLNEVEFGERVYGAEAAARLYFNKPASALTPQQAALLAGSLPNPRVMSPGQPNGRLRSRQRMILSRMRRWGYLYEKKVLSDKPPAEETPASTTATAPATDTVAPLTDTTGTLTETVEPPPTETTPPATETAPATDTTATDTTGT